MEHSTLEEVTDMSKLLGNIDAHDYNNSSGFADRTNERNLAVQQKKQTCTATTKFTDVGTKQ